MKLGIERLKKHCEKQRHNPLKEIAKEHTAILVIIKQRQEMLEHLIDFYRLCLSLKILTPTDKLINTIERATGQKIKDIIK